MMEEKAETSGGAYPLDAFFASFDEHFRGNREDVKERLRTYIPILREHNAAVKMHRFLMWLVAEANGSSC